MMEENTGLPTLVINTHNFEEAKDSLKKYADQTSTRISISNVSAKGFMNIPHNVKGDEFNKIISEIQSRLIDINKLNQGFVDEFCEIYKAFESLDKDYIAGIVGSIQAAEKVSREEQKDRADIKAVVSNLQKTTEVLKNFKNDLEKIKHLMDIDAAYDKLNRQEEMFSQLKQVKHLMNVDEVYDKLAMQEEFIHKQSQSLKTAYIISGVSTVLAIIGIIIGMVL